MHFSTVAVSFLATLSAAIPSPEPQVAKFRPAISNYGVNDACSQQPGGYGPVSNPATPAGFQQFGTFSTVSTAATTPKGYQRTFHNHLQATSGGYYMGLYTLQSYDTAGCSGLCNATSGCNGFNVYFERDPSLNPAPACTNPTAITNYKCTLWGYPPTVANATNNGQMRMSFAVVIAGSNGYAKLGSVAASLPDDGTNPYS